MPSTIDPSAIPAKACQFAADVAVGASAAGSKNVPVKLTARSGQVVDNWWWGRIVHDLAGMKVQAKIPLDYRHDDDCAIGYADQFDTSTGDLVISGALVPYSEDPDDPAAAIIFKAQNGVPYQASIFFDEPLVLEMLAAGDSAEVNGNTVQGPATIVREWTLRGVAVCLYGVDPNTETSLKFSPAKIVEARVINGKMATSKGQRSTLTRPNPGAVDGRLPVGLARFAAGMEAPMTKLNQRRTLPAPPKGVTWPLTS